MALAEEDASGTGTTECHGAHCLVTRRDRDILDEAIVPFIFRGGRNRRIQ